MIPATIRGEISHVLGSNPIPYLIPNLDGWSDSGCLYWDLPSQKEEEKTVLQRYNELASQIIQLKKEDKQNPKIELLSLKIQELLVGVPVTKKFGLSFVSANDVVGLDKTKGIRKEWWELRTRFSDQDICVFQGYQARTTSPTADMIIVMPGRDPYEFLRINRTRGNNYLVETEQIIRALQKLETEFGILIVSAAMDFVELLFDRPIDKKSLARIRQRLHRLCPSAEELTTSIRTGRVGLWWD